MFERLLSLVGKKIPFNLRDEFTRWPKVKGKLNVDKGGDLVDRDVLYDRVRGVHPDN